MQRTTISQNEVMAACVRLALLCKRELTADQILEAITLADAHSKSWMSHVQRHLLKRWGLDADIQGLLTKATSKKRKAEFLKQAAKQFDEMEESIKKDHPIIKGIRKLQV